MKCRNCGAELREGAKFCTKCGTRAETPNAAPARPAAPVRQTPGQAGAAGTAAPMRQTPPEQTGAARPTAPVRQTSEQAGAPRMAAPTRPAAPVRQTPPEQTAAPRPTAPVSQARTDRAKAPGTAARPQESGQAAPRPERQASSRMPSEEAPRKRKFPIALVAAACVVLAAAAGVILWQFTGKMSGTDSAGSGEWGVEDDASGDDSFRKEDLGDGELDGEASGEDLEDPENAGDSAGVETEAFRTADAEADGMETMAAGENETEETAAEETEHRYEVIIKDCTWTEAFEDAKARGGYLVQFNTPDEYEKVKNELLSTDRARKLKLWIGGRRVPGEYQYYWANPDGGFDSEVLNSQPYEWAWMENEPSFRDDSVSQDEYFMNMFYYKSEDRWVWNDVPNDIIAIVGSYKGSVGYICEYDE